ncbi:hypothetical protein COE07_23115 [Bacillus sp. AFS033286]|nr:hypothetical protein COE07_23115 [Bacillus sp. AFS033286]
MRAGAHNKKAPCNRALPVFVVSSSCDSERAASAFSYIQLQRLESPVVSPLHSRQKAPRNQGLQRPAILNEPLPLLSINDL